MRAHHKFCALIAAIILLFHAPVTQAGIRPSFNLEWLSWDATHIVLVSEGDVIDGELTVIESWRGDLKAGDKIKVPELVQFSPEKSRQIAWYGKLTQDPKRPTAVTGKRMVVFLKKTSLLSDQERRNIRNQDLKQEWLACGFGEMKASLAWIDEDESFAFIQIMNPGDSQLISLHLTEKKFKEDVLEVLKVRNNLEDARRIPDIPKRAAALKVYLLSKDHFTQYQARNVLGEGIDETVLLLREFLNDASLQTMHTDFINAFAGSCTPVAGAELTRMLDAELDFWKKTAPTLKNDWRNGESPTFRIDNSDKAKEEARLQALRDRYSHAVHLLQSLGYVRYPACMGVVTQFREYWLSLRQLRGPNKLDEVITACDQTLMAQSKKK